MFKHFSLLLLIVPISGCVKPQPIRLPPVTEGWQKQAATKNAYVVQKNDSLYSIAWAFDIDYHELASVNNLHPPYLLRHGQRLYFATPVSAPTKRSSGENIKFTGDTFVSKPLPGWVWPTNGKVVTGFNSNLGGNKGIDIGGVYGQAILASKQGKVVYSGTGIRSYGKLIIIKHRDDYLSAYAYNKEILVQEGQEIRVGQKIASMGYDNDGNPRLHFEVRRFGKPINPSICLPKKP